MKKIIVFIFSFSLWSLYYSPVYAQTTINIVQPTSVVAGNAVTLSGIVQFIFNFLVALGIIAALAYLLYGGIRWITSQGDKAAVENARNHIVAAIIGLLVLVLAWVIVSLVMLVLGVGSLPKQLTIPTLAGPTPTCSGKPNGATCGSSPECCSFNCVSGVCQP